MAHSTFWCFQPNKQGCLLEQAKIWLWELGELQNTHTFVSGPDSFVVPILDVERVEYSGHVSALSRVLPVDDVGPVVVRVLCHHAVIIPAKGKTQITIELNGYDNLSREVEFSASQMRETPRRVSSMGKIRLDIYTLKKSANHLFPTPTVPYIPDPLSSHSSHSGSMWLHRQ